MMSTEFTPKISVIIPVYNRAQTIARCLKSCLDQTFQDFEIICINDGSTDNSLQILDEYAQNDKRFSVISQQNKGEASARNRALDIAKGDYIAFLDSDDYFHPQALELLYTIAIKTKAPVTCSTRFIRTTKKQHFSVINMNNLSYELHKQPVEDMLKVRYLSSLLWNKLFKKEIFEARRLIEGISNEDWPFITTLFSEIPFYASCDYSVYCYDDTNESVVRSTWTEKRIHDYITSIYFVYQHYQKPENLRYWPQIRSIRIRMAIKMILSKIIHAGEAKKYLASVFYPLYRKMLSDKVIKKSDFSIKSRWRLFKLYGMKGLK